MLWVTESEGAWLRRDGATVTVSGRDLHPKLPWVASGPEAALRRRMRADRREPTLPLRRFASARGTMDAVDAEFPPQDSLGF